jgi:hypothetical protein
MPKGPEKAGGVFLRQPYGFCHPGHFCLNAQGVSGAVLQMVNHGISTGALFLFVGMLYERRIPVTWLPLAACGR